MLREEFGLRVYQLGGLDFEGLGDLRVLLLPRAAQQAAMRRVLHQRVLKAIDRIGRCATLKHQLGANEASQSRLQLILGNARNCMQQRIGKLAADRGTDLCHMPHRRQPVKPCQQGGVQAHRDCKWRQRPIEYVALRLLAKQTAL